MPVLLLERIPLPSLRTYTTISVTLLATALFYTHRTVIGRAEQVLENARAIQEVIEDSPPPVSVAVTLKDYLLDRSAIDWQEDDAGVDPQVYEDAGYVYEFLRVLGEEVWCTWIMVNMAYCCLILFGKMIQKIIFGELRVSEQQHLKDKFWNFVFYKFIFVFGVMNVQHMEEVLMWSAWFSIIGCFDLLAQLCKDRFEYLSFSPTTPAWTHIRVLLLLSGIKLSCCLLLACSFLIGYFYVSPNTFAFMAAECLLLMIKVAYVIVRYAIHLWELYHDGVWENRALYVYYTELIFELSALSVDFLHHLHMLVWSNIFLSMASLVICLQLRYLFHEFQRRVRRHKNYRRVVNSMEARFPLATKQEIEENNDDCAICWEKMATARKLPCSHLFHNACLRSWLEQDTSCPTCRISLSERRQDRRPPVMMHRIPPGAGDAPVPEVPPRPNNRTTNHFFHFDGSRYVSWLPSFSVEVTHTQILGNTGHLQPAPNSQLDNMARQVREVFPTMTLNAIVEDLRMTHSVELTIENIIEGRVAAPPPALAGHGDEDTAASTDTTENTTYTALDDHPPTGQMTSPPADLEPSLSPSHGPGPSLVQGVVSSILPPSEGASGWSATTPTSSPQPVPSTSASDFSYYQDDNAPNVMDSTDQEEAPNAPGSRFSKSREEREAMLLQRKESFLEQAKKRFMLQRGSREQTPVDEPEVLEEPQPSDSNWPSSSIVGSDGEFDAVLHRHMPDGSEVALRRRRELAYRAAARRLQQHD